MNASVLVVPGMTPLITPGTVRPERHWARILGESLPVVPIRNSASPEI